MGYRYTQLSGEERCEIARLQASGRSIRQIAADLDRSPSTIAREMKRNRSQDGRYQPIYADQQCRARRWTGSKLDRDDVLRQVVLRRLCQGWSPEQVAGQLAQDRGRTVLSYETIYRFIYAQIARTKDYSWRHLLPRAKSKRGRRSTKRRSAASYIAHRRPLSERPATVDDRSVPGHWEADLMLFNWNRQAILTLHERQSRLIIAVRTTGKAAQPIAKAMYRLLAPLPPEWRQTVTFDNGTEFARHYDLHTLNIQTFFCKPYSPWQKGGIENAIGRMRRRLPRKTDLASISSTDFMRLIQAYNNTPRKCLDFKSPAEFFWDKLLHFKCESSFPHTRE